jgi:hypothetical protein
MEYITRDQDEDRSNTSKIGPPIAIKTTRTDNGKSCSVSDNAKMMKGFQNTQN